MSDYSYLQNRELSWLNFDRRVLEEAEDISVPLMERMKFIEIFTSNLEEFFMIRVGSLTDLSLLKDEPVDNKTGMSASQQLSEIFKACVPLYKHRDKIFAEVEGALATCNICRLLPSELKGKHLKQVEDWFNSAILPVLSPQLIDARHPFPHLVGSALNIVLQLSDEADSSFGIIPIPKELPPYVILDDVGVHYVLLEDIILEFADSVFSNVTVVDKAVISITRNADISPEDEAFDVEEDFRQVMRKVVKKRTRLSPVRLEIQGKKKPEIAAFLSGKLSLAPERIFYTKSPIRLKYIYALEDKLSSESAAALCNKPYTPRPNINLDMSKPLIPQFLKQDFLSFYPFESMDPFLMLVREAANDPEVLSIRITIYRLASKAKLAQYLCAAAENGKSVTVVMELRARFDEQNNIEWAERLEESGCTVLYGSEGIKVHSKVCLITRRSPAGTVEYITQVGTGNYNEKTAKLYTDLSLITSDPQIGADAAALFQNIGVQNYEGHYTDLLASPYQMRNKICQLIDGEIAKGSNGYIFLKLNSISDKMLIDKLEGASRAGVEIIMNVRGICCILPNIPGHTEKMRIFSIVGRFLEHTRIYRFGRGDDAELYISSADFMTRNMARRVEIACPVKDPITRAKLFRIIDVLIHDNVKAREIGPDGKYHKIPVKSSEPVRSQDYFMNTELEEKREIPAEPEKPHGFLSALRGIFGK